MEHKADTNSFAPHVNAAVDAYSGSRWSSSLAVDGILCQLEAGMSVQLKMTLLSVFATTYA